MAPSPFGDLGPKKGPIRILRSHTNLDEDHESLTEIEEHDEAIKEKRKKLESICKNIITQWFDNISKISAFQEDNKMLEEYICQSLAKKLSYIQIMQLRDKEVRLIMFEEIWNHLDYVLEKKSQYMTSKEQTEWTNQLIDGIISAIIEIQIKVTSKESLADLHWNWYDIDEIKEELLQWLHILESDSCDKKPIISDKMEKITTSSETGGFKANYKTILGFPCSMVDISNINKEKNNTQSFHTHDSVKSMSHYRICAESKLYYVSAKNRVGLKVSKQIPYEIKEKILSIMSKNIDVLCELKKLEAELNDIKETAISRNIDSPIDGNEKEILNKLGVIYDKQIDKDDITKMLTDIRSIILGNEQKDTKNTNTLDFQKGNKHIFGNLNEDKIKRHTSALYNIVPDKNEKIDSQNINRSTEGEKRKKDIDKKKMEKFASELEERVKEFEESKRKPIVNTNKIIQSKIKDIFGNQLNEDEIIDLESDLNSIIGSDNPKNSIRAKKKIRNKLRKKFSYLEEDEIRSLESKLNTIVEEIKDPKGKRQGKIKSSHPNKTVTRNQLDEQLDKNKMEKLASELFNVMFGDVRDAGRNRVKSSESPPTRTDKKAQSKGKYLLGHQLDEDEKRKIKNMITKKFHYLDEEDLESLESKIYNTIVGGIRNPKENSQVKSKPLALRRKDVQKPGSDVSVSEENLPVASSTPKIYVRNNRGEDSKDKIRNKRKPNEDKRRDTRNKIKDIFGNRLDENEIKMLESDLSSIIGTDEEEDMVVARQKIRNKIKNIFGDLDLDENNIKRLESKLYNAMVGENIQSSHKLRKAGNPTIKINKNIKGKPKLEEIPVHLNKLTSKKVPIGSKKYEIRNVLNKMFGDRLDEDKIKNLELNISPILVRAERNNTTNIRQEIRKTLKKYFIDLDKDEIQKLESEMFNIIVGDIEDSEDQSEKSSIRSKIIIKKTMTDIFGNQLDEAEIERIESDLSSIISREKSKDNARTKTEIHDIIKNLFSDLDENEIKGLETVLYNCVVGYVDPPKHKLRNKTEFSNISYERKDVQNEIHDFFGDKLDENALKNLESDLFAITFKPQDTTDVKVEIRNKIKEVFGDVSVDVLKKVESELYNAMVGKSVDSKEKVQNLSNLSISGEKTFGNKIYSNFGNQLDRKDMTGLRSECSFITHEDQFKDNTGIIKNFGNKITLEDLKDSKEKLNNTKTNYENKNRKTFTNLDQDKINKLVDNENSNVNLRQKKKLFHGTKKIKDMFSQQLDEINMLESISSSIMLGDKMRDTDSLRKNIRNEIKDLFVDIEKHEINKIESKLCNTQEVGLQNIKDKFQNKNTQCTGEKNRIRNQIRDVLGNQLDEDEIKRLETVFSSAMVGGRLRDSASTRNIILTGIRDLFGDLYIDKIKRIESELFNAVSKESNSRKKIKNKKKVSSNVKKYIQSNTNDVFGYQLDKDECVSLESEQYSIFDENQFKVNDSIKNNIKNKLLQLFGYSVKNEMKMIKPEMYTTMVGDIKYPRGKTRNKTEPSPRKEKDLQNKLKDLFSDHLDEEQMKRLESEFLSIIGTKPTKKKNQDKLKVLHDDLDDDDTESIGSETSTLSRKVRDTLEIAKDKMMSPALRKQKELRQNKIRDIFADDLGEDEIIELQSELYSIFGGKKYTEDTKKQIRNKIKELLGDIDERKRKMLETEFFNIMTHDPDETLQKRKKEIRNKLKDMFGDQLDEDQINRLETDLSAIFRGDEIKDTAYAKSKIQNKMMKLFGNPSQKGKSGVIGDQDDDEGNMLKSHYSETMSEDSQDPIKTTSNMQGGTITYETPMDKLNKFVESWCDSLPVKGNPEYVKGTKQNLASNIMKTIAELNMNPEIFNDDELYTEMLQDEIQNLLMSIPKNLGLYIKVSGMTDDLISQILETRQTLLNDIAGKHYKSQLKNTVYSILPNPSNMSTSRRAELELLIEKIADAFITSRFAPKFIGKYCPNGERISDYQDFCNSMLRFYPCIATINRLCYNLYNALLRVPAPDDNLIKSELEQVILRDIIHNWMQPLPLKAKPISEKLRTFKQTSLLAKRLYDIETETDHNSHSETERRMNQEIVKFLKKLPLADNTEQRIPQMSKNLIEQLRKNKKYQKHVCYKRMKSVEVPVGSCSENNCNLQRREEQLLELRYYKMNTACTGESCQNTYGEKKGTDIAKNPRKFKPVISGYRISCISPQRDAASMTPLVDHLKLSTDSQIFPPFLSSDFSMNACPTSDSCNQSTSFSCLVFSESTYLLGKTKSNCHTASSQTQEWHTPKTSSLCHTSNYPAMSKFDGVHQKSATWGSRQTSINYSYQDNDTGFRCRHRHRNMGSQVTGLKANRSQYKYNDRIFGAHRSWIRGCRSRRLRILNKVRFLNETTGRPTE